MLKRINTILFLFISFASAIDIKMDKDFYELKVPPNKMVVIDFPFDIKDRKAMGDSSLIKGNIYERSLYFKIQEGTIDFTVWGGDKPLLLSIIASKKEKNRKFSFVAIKDEIAKLKKLSKEWNHDKLIANQINIYANKGSINGFDKVELNEIYKIGNIKVKKVERINSTNYSYEKWIVQNISKELVDLFNKKDLYFTKRKNQYVIDSLSIDNRYILPNQYTTCYVGLERIKHEE